MSDDKNTPWKTREYKNQKQREWRERHPDKSREYVLRAYTKRRSTPEGWLAQILSSAKARAMRRGLASDIAASEIEMPARCPILGTKLSYIGTKKNYATAASLDRIDPNKGYVKGNVRIISRLANLLRGNCLDPQVFYALARDAEQIKCLMKN